MRYTVKIYVNNYVCAAFGELPTLAHAETWALGSLQRIRQYRFAEIWEGNTFIKMYVKE